MAFNTIIGVDLDDQVEIDAHYSRQQRQSHDIAAFKKDEGIKIPDKIDYDIFSGLSNEIKSKLKTVRPKTLGQALSRWVTPAAAIILLGYIKSEKKGFHLITESNVKRILLKDLNFDAPKIKKLDNFAKNSLFIIKNTI